MTDINCLKAEVHLNYICKLISFLTESMLLVYYKDRSSSAVNCNLCWLWKPQEACEFYVLLTVHPCISRKYIQLGTQFCLIYLFISLLYMFWASTCPSSGENCCICVTLVFVTLYGWRQQTPSVQSDKYQCRIDIAIFSRWRARGCPKHVEKRSK